MGSIERLDAIHQEYDSTERRLHLQRYHLASQWAVGGVFDLACGYGYGSRFLRDDNVFWYHGIDKDVDAIEYAQAEYGTPYVESPLNSMRLIPGKCNFEVGDLNDIESIPSLHNCDTIVTLETLEHLENWELFLRAIQKLAWRIILSVPVIPTVHKNRFHVNDFTSSQVDSWFQCGKWKLQYEDFQPVKDKDIYGCWVYDKS